MHRAANYYTLWVHIALMVLLGFSFLYTFMRKYAYTAITQSFLIVALAVQWYPLCAQISSPFL